VAILLDDPSRFVLDHQFRVLVLSELTSSSDRPGLPIVQRVSPFGSACLYRPTSALRSTAICGLRAMRQLRLVATNGYISDASALLQASLTVASARTGSAM